MSDQPSTAAAGALAGRVGFSLVGEKALGLFLSENSHETLLAVHFDEVVMEG